MMRIQFLLCSIFILSCASQKKVVQRAQPVKARSTTVVTHHNPVHPDRPKNIIFLIGDGMGITQITAAMYSNCNTLNLEQFPVIGLHKSYASNDLITDSAAGATAFSIGKKTKNGYIGVDSTGKAHQTILEEADARGLATGMVTTSTVVHATPACFIAHNASRRNYEYIADDYLKTPIDIFIGGGKKYFDRREKDSLDLIRMLKANNYYVSDYYEKDLSQVQFPLHMNAAYFTADGDPLPASNGRDYLPLATEKAIQFLDKKSNNKGFFIMIEGAQIDWGGHANNAEYIVSEMLDFDNAIGRALEFAIEDKHTLVVVTADHETGGFAVVDSSKMNNLKYAFTSKDHTPDLIPVFAFGPGALEFSGIYENTAIYTKMRNLLLGK